MTEQVPPPLQGPTSKERKYDRQLRLWAANGQAALEDARILLVNSGSGVVGIEVLKNLVLPGVCLCEVTSRTITDKHVRRRTFHNLGLSKGDRGRSRCELLPGR